MDKKTTGIVAYITWIGWLIAFLAGDKEGAKFHLNQALVINIAAIASTVLSVVLAFIPFVGGLLSMALSICIFVFAILGLVSACNGEEKELPIFGQIKILK